MKTKWTPGPWTFYERPFSCSVQPPHDGSEAVDEIASVPNRSETDRSEMVANAALIALSPEWPDVLRALVDDIRSISNIGFDDETTEHLNKARALLAKLEST